MSAVCGSAVWQPGRLTGCVMMQPDSGHRSSSGVSPRALLQGERSTDAITHCLSLQFWLVCRPRITRAVSLAFGGRAVERC